MSKYKSFSSKIKQFHQEQLKEWPFAYKNYQALNLIRFKNFDLGACKVRVQYNPARRRSTGAKVDAQSIQQRKCFLCQENLPSEQRGIPYKDNYIILINPYPIFPIHFTIVDAQHTKQQIYNRFKDMLDLAKDMDEFVIFYNGPRCGATAPDHMHFQAGSKGLLPLELDVKNIKKQFHHKDKGMKIYGLKGYIRNVIVIETKKKEKAIEAFTKTYKKLETTEYSNSINQKEQEPMMNILSWYENGRYYVCIFPRKKHRPDCYYAEGKAHLMFSPASVDMAGLCVFPRAQHFLKVTAEHILQVYEEV